jgi:hypothetical protein
MPTQKTTDLTVSTTCGIFPAQGGEEQA